MRTKNTQRLAEEDGLLPVPPKAIPVDDNFLAEGPTEYVGVEQPSTEMLPDQDPSSLTWGLGVTGLVGILVALLKWYLATRR